MVLERRKETGWIFGKREKAEAFLFQKLGNSSESSAADNLKKEQVP